jgi:hypothetical protein
MAQITITKEEEIAGCSKSPSSLGQGARPGLTIAKQSVGRWVNKVAQGGRVSSGKAHVPACAGRAGEMAGFFDSLTRGRSISWVK